MIRAVVSAAATAGQYVVPLICLGGAALSAWRRRTRRQLIHRATDNDAAAAIDGLSWQQFEQLIGEAFRLQGYSVVETGGSGTDGGVDLVLSKGREKFLVQCKHWRAFKVGVEIVRELYGVMAARGAAGGFVVTSGRFTAEAEKFAQGRNVTLLNGQQLGEWLAHAKQRSPAAAEAPRALSPIHGTETDAAPKCPTCKSSMVLRTASRGPKSGTRFWGCSTYPSCRGTRAVS